MKKFILLVFLLTFKLGSAQNFINEYLLHTKAARLDTLVNVKANNNESVQVPITIIKGAKKGPTFTITAGIHGMEYPTIMSLVSFSREIDPKVLKGNLIIMPVVNMPSFYGRVPFKNPMDGLNLNRVFPGDKNGSITQVMAHFMTTTLFPVTDILLDMHGGDVGEDLIPFICYYDNKEFSKQTALAAQLSNVSGFEKIVVYPYTLKKDQPAQYAFKQAVRQGVTALSIEIGKLGEYHEAEANETKDAIYRMLSELNMYNKKVTDTKVTHKYYNQ